MLFSFEVNKSFFSISIILDTEVISPSSQYRHLICFVLITGFSMVVSITRPLIVMLCSRDYLKNEVQPCQGCVLLVTPRLLTFTDINCGLMLQYVQTSQNTIR